MQSRGRLFRGWVLLSFTLGSCAHVLTQDQRADPRDLLRSWCSVHGPLEIKGSVWMKAKSKEASGQFPARVRAKSVPGKPQELWMEITQLLGARAALIEIRGHEFKVETAKERASRKNAVSWGGIPLDLAAQLFIDQIPCPNEAELMRLTWAWTPDDQLEGRDEGGEAIWRFGLRKWNLQPWVEKVFWRIAADKTLELNRDDPDPAEGWARRWEIQSPVGQVKVRWKDREKIELKEES